MQSDSSPAENAAAVTPSDTGAFRARALYIGTGGDVTLDVGTSTNILFKSVPTGTILPIAAKRVYATGTTATNIVAIW